MGISVWQILLVLVVVMLLFGAGKIPRVMGDFAKGIKSFKKGMQDDDDDDRDTVARRDAPPPPIEGRSDSTVDHEPVRSRQEDSATPR